MLCLGSQWPYQELTLFGHTDEPYLNIDRDILGEFQHLSENCYLASSATQKAGCVKHTIRPLRLGGSTLQKKDYSITVVLQVHSALPIRPHVLPVGWATDSLHDMSLRDMPLLYIYHE